MWELDHKEGWVLKNWRFQTVELEKTLESPPDSKDIKPVNPKGNQLWIFIGRTGAEAEAPILWLPDMKSQLIAKDPDAGKDEGQEEKGVKEDEMVGWHHWLNGHEFEQTLGEMTKDRGAWCAAVHEISESQIQLGDWTTIHSPLLIFFFATGGSRAASVDSLVLLLPIRCRQLGDVRPGGKIGVCIPLGPSLQIDFLFPLGSGNHSFSIALAGMGVVRALWMAPSLFGFLSPCSQISRYSLY